MVGHCSKCHKVWTLETRQGVCQWCGKLAVCQTIQTQALRSLKSRSNGRKRQAEDNHNGYDQLTGDWLTYYKVTGYFVKHILYQDREDWLHDTMLEMAKVKAKYELIGKPLTEAGLMRVAKYQVYDYWRSYFRHLNGVDCHNCGKTQRRKCREDKSQSECPKYREFISLDTELDDGNGDKTSFAEFIADDNAIDLDARLDAKAILRGLPKRVIKIGYKRRLGIPLDNKERNYLYHFQKKALTF
jgi:DNA-directed RNA polymerase specialized sigma24 family protein